MILPLLGLIATPLQEMGPTLPAGSSEAFQKTAVAVQRELQKKSFAKAKTLAFRLPRTEIVITVDENGLKPLQKSEFRTAITRAAKAWQRQVPEFKWKLGPKGDIKIGFAPTVAVNPASGHPGGMAMFVSDDPAEPRVELVIALNRSKEAVASTRFDVHNDVVLGLGAYLGLAESPNPFSIMFRRDTAASGESQIAMEERTRAHQLLSIAKSLRQAVLAKKVLVPATPEISLDTQVLVPKEVVQGEPGEVSFGVSNPGNTPLKFQIIPDCSCFSFRYTGTVEAGKTGVVQVRMDTSSFPGPFAKNLYILSNDPERPTVKLPVKFYVEPRYRFLAKPEQQVYVIGESGLNLPIYFLRGRGANYKVLNHDVSGAPAMLEINPWSGMIADAQMGRKPEQREGYKLDLLISSQVPPGRVPITITIVTDDPVFSEMRHTIFVQKGIIANPTSVYLGEITREPTTALFNLSQPGQPFKVTNIVSSHASIKATAKSMGSGDEHRVSVQYDGKAEFGELSGTLTISTDSPDQPTITVPILGYVR